MLFSAYYAKNYAGIIDTSLKLNMLHFVQVIGLWSYFVYKVTIKPAEYTL